MNNDEGEFNNFTEQNVSTESTDDGFPQFQDTGIPYQNYHPAKQKGLLALIFGILSVIASSSILIMDLVVQNSGYIAWAAGFFFSFVVAFFILPLMVILSLLALIFGLRAILKYKHRNIKSILALIFSLITIGVIVYLIIINVASSIRLNDALKPLETTDGSSVTDVQLIDTGNPDYKKFKSKLSGVSFELPSSWSISISDVEGIYFITKIETSSGDNFYLNEDKNQLSSSYCSTNTMVFEDGSTNIDGLAVISYQYGDNPNDSGLFHVVASTYSGPYNINVNQCELDHYKDFADLIGSKLGKIELYYVGRVNDLSSFKTTAEWREIMRVFETLKSE
jgi:hypothetical protein